MNTFLYIIIFIIGTLFGSFVSLAIYRIPLEQNILNKRSYCPKCMHNLKFFDLIPILSYVFLKGKCRYCKEKISKKYLLLEIFTGLIFILFAWSLKINIYNIDLNKCIEIFLAIIFITTLFLIAGIDKEKHFIAKQIILFGLITKITHIIYLYVLNVNIDIYKYIIYLIILLIILIIEMILLKKKAKNNYTVNILILCIYLVIFSKEEIVILSIITTLILVAIKSLMIKFNKNIKENLIKEEIDKIIPIGTYLCFSNIIITILYNFLKG